MKFCGSCKAEKKDRDFHIRQASADGLSSKCKSCQKVYDKFRANDKSRESARVDYAKTERGKEARNRARQRYKEKNKNKIYESTKKYRKKFPNKAKAHGVVSYAVRCGNLCMEPCEICGESIAVAHHDDYLKPLNVRWLCDAHHKKWHQANGEGANA